MRWKVVTVEEGLGGADEEWDGHARQVGTEGLATTGDIVREIENGPGLTGRMENEIMPVLFGRTEAMQTDDRGEMGYPGIGAGHWRDQRGCWRSHVYPYPSYLPYSYTLPAYLNGPVTGILTGPGEKSGAEHVMCIAKNRRLQNGKESNERIIRGNLPLADEYPRKTAHSLERRGHVLCRSSRAIPCTEYRTRLASSDVYQKANKVYKVPPTFGQPPAGLWSADSANCFFSSSYLWTVLCSTAIAVSPLFTEASRGETLGFFFIFWVCLHISSSSLPFVPSFFLILYSWLFSIAQSLHSTPCRWIM